MDRYRIQRKDHKTTNTDYTKKRHYTIIRCKLAKTTVNYRQQNLTGRTHQPIRKHLHKIHQVIQNQPRNQKHRSEDPNKTGMLPYPTKSQTNTIPPTEKRDKRTRPTNKVRTPWKIRNNWKRLFRITRSNYGAVRKDQTVKIALDARKLN